MGENITCNLPTSSVQISVKIWFYQIDDFWNFRQALSLLWTTRGRDRRQWIKCLPDQKANSSGVGRVDARLVEHVNNDITSEVVRWVIVVPRLRAFFIEIN